MRLPPPAAWPDRPLLLRKSTAVHASEDACSVLGVPFPVETELFVGQAVLRLRGTPGSEDYFAGKARRTSFVVSGRFKRALPFAELYTGQEFEHALRLSGPTKLIVGGVLKAVRLLAPLLRVRLSERGSYLLSPLVQTAQAMHVGTAPLPLTPGVAVLEDTALLGGALGASSLTAAARRRHFSTVKNLAPLSFDPALYYSFDFYDDKLCLDSFMLDLLGRHDLVGVLAGQPIRLLSRVLGAAGGAPAFGWDVEVWHERLLAGAAGTASGAQQPPRKTELEMNRVSSRRS